MRFHDFEVEGGGGTKLEEWHSLAKMRPLAPPAHKPKPEADPRQAGAAPSQPDGKKPKTPGAQAPAFLRKLVEGNALELLHEDGIWPVDLVGISDEKGYRPPRTRLSPMHARFDAQGDDPLELTLCWSPVRGATLPGPLQWTQPPQPTPFRHH